MVSAALQALVGQPQAVELLSQAIALNRIAPAYLFVGPAGVGRRLAAQLFLAELLGGQAGHRPSYANHPDLLWVEPTYLQKGKLKTAAALLAEGESLPKSQPQVRLEQIRQISQFLSQSPLEASRFLVVIEGAETMGEAAANGLLKTLEEPGHGSLILLAPTSDALLPTLVSRCQTIPFYRLSLQDLQMVLQQQGHTDLLQHPHLLALAQGSPGKAIADWTQLQAIPEALLNIPKTPITSLRQGLTLARQVEQSLDSAAQLWLLDYLQQQYWLSQGNAKALDQCEAAKRYLRQYVQPRLVWEVTFAALVQSGG